MKKKKKHPIANIFRGPPSDPDPKKFSLPPFCHESYRSTHRKARKLNFYWKICGNFFQGPPLVKRVNNFEGPLFASVPLPYRKCALGKVTQNVIKLAVVH